MPYRKHACLMFSLNLLSLIMNTTRTTIYYIYRLYIYIYIYGLNDIYIWYIYIYIYLKYMIYIYIYDTHTQTHTHTHTHTHTYIYIYIFVSWKGAQSDKIELERKGAVNPFEEKRKLVLLQEWYNKTMNSGACY